MVIGVNEHALLSFTTAKMIAAERSISGSPAHFRDRTMRALNAPAKVVSRYYIRCRAMCAAAATTCVNLIFWTSINVPADKSGNPGFMALPNARQPNCTFFFDEIIPRNHSRLMRIGQPWNIIVMKFVPNVQFAAFLR